MPEKQRKGTRKSILKAIPPLRKIQMYNNALEDLKIYPGDKVLNYNINQGWTTEYLAKNVNVIVFDMNPLTEATDRWQEFAKSEYSDRIIPMNAPVFYLPLPKGYFDEVVVFTGFFGMGEEPEYYINRAMDLVKTNGQILFLIPGLNHEWGWGIPQEFKALLNKKYGGNAYKFLHALNWWKKKISQYTELEIVSGKELEGARKVWYDEGGVARRFMRADADRNITMFALIVKKKGKIK